MYVLFNSDFKYKKGSDSVLLVKKEDYDSCNTNNPIKKMEDGDSSFVFDKSGPFFFISGNADNCKKGQKLVVVVMAKRAKRTPPSPPAVAPTSKAPSPAAVSPSVETPQPSQYPSGSDAPAPAPSDKSDSARSSGGSFGVALSISIGVISVSFAGLI